MEINNHFKLFKSSLLSFHAKSKELPINLDTILMKITIEYEFYSGGDFLQKSIEERVDALCKYIDKLYYHSDVEAFAMYSFIITSEQIFRFYRFYIADIILASQITLDNPEQRDTSEYWLTAWHPKKVIDEANFKIGINESENIWLNETAFLKENLFGLIFCQPFAPLPNFWENLGVVYPKNE